MARSSLLNRYIGGERMISDFSMKGRKKISYLFELMKYNIKFRKENPTYFYPDGLLLYSVEVKAQVRL